MFVHLHKHDDKPIPGLVENIAKQQEVGGQLILYRRAWSAIALTVTQDRIEHVPAYSSRILAGWKHSLFTVLLGIWSPVGVIAVPMLLIWNFRGGVDVTGKFSDTSIDPLRALPPDFAQAKTDVAAIQWTFIVLGIAVVVAVIYFFMDSPFPK